MTAHVKDTSFEKATSKAHSTSIAQSSISVSPQSDSHPSTDAALLVSSSKAASCHWPIPVHRHILQCEPKLLMLTLSSEEGELSPTSAENV